MASGDKSAKTQLIAIYRLEFYKNKKNWKLYENARKEAPPSSKTANKLNMTYNVGEEFPEPEHDVEQVSPHNKAFLGEEPEDGPDPQPPDEPPPLPAPGYNLYRPHSWPEQPWSGEKTEELCQDAPQDWSGAGVEPGSMPQELAYDQCDGPRRQHNQWTPAPQLELRPAADALDQLLQCTEEWMRRHGYPLPKDCVAASDEYGLVDDIADFMRGAHEASHSSEIDLSVTPDCPCTCDGLLYMLSERQLARAVQRHHCALVHLLGEQALRERPYTHSHLHHQIPFEDCPTRDTDPFRPDVVLAGSHLLPISHIVPNSHVSPNSHILPNSHVPPNSHILSNSHVPPNSHIVPSSHIAPSSQGAVSGLSLAPDTVSGLSLAPDTGRGRGRLQQAHRIIGIGMGRPYRL